MIKKFTIKNFKCFEQIVTKPYERITLIAGKNNIGKTALLEAIWLHEGAHNAGLAFSVEQFRGITSFNNKEFLGDLFSGFQSDREIVLEAEYQDGKILTLKIAQEESGEPRPITDRPEVQGTTSISPKVIFEGIENENSLCKSEFFLGLNPQGRPMPFSSGGKKMLRPTAVLVSTGPSKETKNKINAERFSVQVEKKRKKDILESLRLIDDRLQDLELSKRGPENYVCGDVGQDKMLPLSLMGEGMDRYLSYVLSILIAEGGTVLIDEIENGFYHSIHNKMWKNLAMLARKYKVQIIATTHSYECIQAAHESFKEDKEYDFILHRLDRVGERIEDVTYDKDTLEAALNSNMEIR